MTLTEWSEQMGALLRELPADEELDVRRNPVTGNLNVYEGGECVGYLDLMFPSQSQPFVYQEEEA